MSQKAGVAHKEPLKKGAPGHGCGHNVHGTSGMGAVLSLRYTLESEGLKGTIKFFGTPAEENYGGKVFMVRDGLFDDVDACLSHHPNTVNTARLGSSNAVNGVKFAFHGKTAHAAGSPEQGRSSLDAIELMNIGVNYLREHIIDDARIHYVIEEGGGQPNVVPDYARSWYYIRAPERDQLDPIYDRIKKIAKGAALMTDTELEVQFIDALYNVLPNKVLSDTVIENMRKIGAPEYTEEEFDFAKKIGDTVTLQQKINALRKSKIPDYERYIDVDLVTDILDPWDEGEVSPGSSDVGDVSWVCPTMEFGTTCNVLGVPGHSWQWVSTGKTGIAHKSLLFAAKVIAGSALDLITRPELLEKAKRDHEERLGGRTYETPLPKGLEPPLEIARETSEKLRG
ncbi:MAG: amidohydrolase [Candidatus Bathyarchaeia archaeon]